MLLFAAVALSLPSQAQVKFGLKGGLNLTNLSLSESIGNNLKSKEGFHIGPTVKIGLPVPGLSVDASALYDQRSAKVSVTRGVSGAEVESTLKSQSLQVPINIRYAVGLGSVANLFAFAGPQFGFNLTGRFVLPMSAPTLVLVRRFSITFRLLPTTTLHSARLVRLSSGMLPSRRGMPLLTARPALGRYQRPISSRLIFVPIFYATHCLV